jgi:hypothetical protein
MLRMNVFKVTSRASSDRMLSLDQKACYKRQHLGMQVREATCLQLELCEKHAHMSISTQEVALCLLDNSEEDEAEETHAFRALSFSICSTSLWSKAHQYLA